MSRSADDIGLVLAAHGERRAGAANQGVTRLAATLAARGVVPEIGYGFLNGTLTIPDAIGAIGARNILVYPLLLSDGFFFRRLLETLAAIQGLHATRTISLLPPLGLDPSLADLVAQKASLAARPKGAANSTLVLVAHGSPQDPASRASAEALGRQLAEAQRFAGVRTAYLDEPPAFAEVCARIPGPMVAVGLFAGDGLHGRHDMSRLIAQTGRRDIAYAGIVGAWPELAEIVAQAAAGPRAALQNLGWRLAQPVETAGA